ncbi:lantibiotic dehydratase [Streptomyces sp. HUAS MG91]|uniref:Lantibiotic dehydratase n=1 Tax=Streptomyces tabacisoli TaxID=3156398 RepID=A0AAU8J4R4_9ACTN
MASRAAYRCGDVALVRAVTRPILPFPPCPDLDDPAPGAAAARLQWLRTVWNDQETVEALGHASPAFAERINTLLGAPNPPARDIGKATASVLRYLLRAAHRATPFGLLAGVALAPFGPSARAEWGTGHKPVVQPSAPWLARVVERLESCPELLDRLPVMVNSTVSVRGDRLVVPFRSPGQGDMRAVETSIGLSAPVCRVLDAAQDPIRFDALVGKLAADFPGVAADTVNELVVGLLRHRVLLTSLHAPSTQSDALGHLLHQLDAADAARLPAACDLVREVRAAQEAVRKCEGRYGRHRAAASLRAAAPGLTEHPLALDLRLDASLVLPRAVAQELERAATVLTTVSPLPYGTAEWKAYQRRFYERYGIGTMVPMLDVVADSGIGFPDGYPGTNADTQRRRLSVRDDTLLRLAQTAVLDGHDEVTLTDELIAAMNLGPDRPRNPPHLEITARIHAASTEDLSGGRFGVEVLSVSRGAGVISGRFLNVLDADDREALAAELRELPTADPDTIAAQLSFPPLRVQSAHVTRTPRVLPTVISLDEHRPRSDDVLTPADLAVACDGRRMYLAAPAQGRRIEAVALHALNLRQHTPPLARLLSELARAQYAQVTDFDWGAANALPYLPRLRYGRTILAAARWRLAGVDFPGEADKFDEWRSRRRLPRHVHLVQGDRHLRLDLDDTVHRGLLRRHLQRAGQAVVTEAPPEDASGWCDGRAHEVVVPLKAVRPVSWPTLPTPTRDRLFSAAQAQPPGTGSLLLATLYGDLRRQDVLLGQYLPGLLEQLGGPPWWFIRFRDPDPHLRLRIALPDSAAFGDMAAVVSRWADELRAERLLSDFRFPTSYREMGRWGSGLAWQAAEDVFRADSRAMLAQLALPNRPAARILAVAHTVAIATQFLGDTRDGMRWIIDHVPATAPAPVARTQFSESVRLADPSDDWTALRRAPGGSEVVDAWADRTAALAAYRPHLPGPHTRGIAVDDVLASLLHTHFVRHIGIDFDEEAVCLYLARATALSWMARRNR